MLTITDSVAYNINYRLYSTYILYIIINIFETHEKHHLILQEYFHSFL